MRSTAYGWAPSVAASQGVGARMLRPVPREWQAAAQALEKIGGASHGVRGRALRLVHSLDVGQEPRARALAHHLLLVVAQQHLPCIVGVPAQPSKDLV